MRMLTFAGFPPLIPQFSRGGSYKTIVISSPLIPGFSAKVWTFREVCMMFSIAHSLIGFKKADISRLALALNIVA